jgi:hypothetical protein
VGGNKKIAEVLRVTKLNTVFHTGGKTEEAVEIWSNVVDEG